MKIQFSIELHRALKEEANAKGCSIPALVCSKLKELYNIK